MLNLLLLTLGLAWLTQQAGLSLALGAFICGVLISETEFRVQVAAEIRPFHDVLLGLFFVTIGMLLDLRQVALQWPLVLLLLVVPVLFKLVLVSALARLLGASTGVALRTGLYLAQAGEFGFVMLTLSRREGWWRPSCFTPSWRRWCCRCWPRPSSSWPATASCCAWWPASGCNSRCR